MIWRTDTGDAEPRLTQDEMGGDTQVSDTWYGCLVNGTNNARVYLYGYAVLSVDDRYTSQVCIEYYIDENQVDIEYDDDDLFDYDDMQEAFRSAQSAVREYLKNPEAYIIWDGEDQR
jgi:hypothetical protein